MRTSFCERIYKLESPLHDTHLALHLTFLNLATSLWTFGLICSSRPYLPPNIHIYSNVSNFEYWYIENWKWAGTQTKPLKTKRSVHNMVFRLTICVEYMLISKYDNNLLTAYISNLSPWREKEYYGRQDVEGKKIGRELLKGIDFTGVRVAILVS